jgi:hypothetical protein
MRGQKPAQSQRIALRLAEGSTLVKQRIAQERETPR